MQSWLSLNMDKNTTFTQNKQKSDTLARCSIMLSTVYTSSGCILISERLNVTVRDQTRATQSHNIDDNCYTHDARNPMH